MHVSNHGIVTKYPLSDIGSITPITILSPCIPCSIIILPSCTPLSDHIISNISFSDPGIPTVDHYLRSWHFQHVSHAWSIPTFLQCILYCITILSPCTAHRCRITAFRMYTVPDQMFCYCALLPDPITAFSFVLLP